MQNNTELLQEISETEELDICNQRVLFQSADNLSNLHGINASLVVTSPPYWNLKKYGSSSEIGQSSYEEYLERLTTVWNECFRAAGENSVLIVNVNNRRHNKKYYPIAFDIANHVQNWSFWDCMMWYVPNALPQPNHYMDRLFDNKFEYLLVFVKGDPMKHTFNKPRVPQKYAEADPRQSKKNPNGRCLGNVIRIPAYRPPNVKTLNYHVAAYPEELAALLIETYTNENDIVFDPFLGSGTTLKVARAMNRRGVGTELNKEYRELIESKIQEDWHAPDWKQLDILHSSSNTPGMGQARKAQFGKSKVRAQTQLDINT